MLFRFWVVPDCTFLDISKDRAAPRPPPDATVEAV